LRADGYHVTSVIDGAELLKTLRARRQGAARPSVDLVVTDIHMPAFSGLEALADLRSKDLALPVVLITAFGDAQTHAEARALGATAIVDKPFDVDDLRTLVLNLLTPHRHAPGPPWGNRGGH
jgi:CheY-like chemotaxis protein